MKGMTKISAEYEKALQKKQELSEKLKALENTEPKNFHDIWMTRDQIAYWQGMAEGLKFAMDEMRDASSQA
jgi:uncharacterized hydantoinase/oxoprolinase family protein